MQIKIKKEWTCEIVQDFNNLYYANLYVDGVRVELPEYVEYTTLRKAIKDKIGIEILKKWLIFEKISRKSYAYVGGDGFMVTNYTRANCPKLR